MEDLMEMSKKERTRLEIILKVNNRAMKCSAAAAELDISVRHLRRLISNFRVKGAEGLISQKRGQPSNNKLPEDLKTEIIGRIQEEYTDFGPTLAHEKLTYKGEFQVSLGSVRNIMISSGIWKVSKKKRAAVHQMRKRRERTGELVQIDGSPHDWF